MNHFMSNTDDMSVMITNPLKIAAQYSCCFEEYRFTSHQLGLLGRLINRRMSAVPHIFILIHISPKPHVVHFTSWLAVTRSSLGREV